MNTLNKFLVSLFGIVVSMGISILVLIHGWGLEPKSWMWIIVLAFIGNFVAALLVALGTTKEA